MCHVIDAHAGACRQLNIDADVMSKNEPWPQCMQSHVHCNGIIAKNAWSLAIQKQAHIWGPRGSQCIDGVLDSGFTHVMKLIVCTAESQQKAAGSWDIQDLGFMFRVLGFAHVMKCIVYAAESQQGAAGGWDVQRQDVQRANMDGSPEAAPGPAHKDQGLLCWG